MDFLATPFGVLLILAAVAVAAFSFVPASYAGKWKQAAKLYATDRRPSAVSFSGEEVVLGKNDFMRIDAALDDGGFWIVPRASGSGEAPDCLLIPWDCIRFKAEMQHKYNFQLRLKDPVEFYVSAELGSALRRRSQSMPTGVQP